MTDFHWNETEMTQRTSMWLNLYGRQAVLRELKKGLKTQKMHFSPFLLHPNENLSTFIG